jgi:hypothetical protein
VASKLQSKRGFAVIFASYEGVMTPYEGTTIMNKLILGILAAVAPFATQALAADMA